METFARYYLAPNVIVLMPPSVGRVDGGPPLALFADGVAKPTGTVVRLPLRPAPLHRPK
jgi:hypothetical protein